MEDILFCVKKSIEEAYLARDYASQSIGATASQAILLCDLARRSCDDSRRLAAQACKDMESRFESEDTAKECIRYFLGIASKGREDACGTLEAMQCPME